jgi:hypothetical protein
MDSEHKKVLFCVVDFDVTEGHNFLHMKYLLTFLLLSSCSLWQEPLKLSDDPGSNHLPPWVYSPYDECNQNLELCAVGEGGSLKEATSLARTNLASIFEVEVKSELNIENSSQQYFPWQGDVRQEVNQSVTESISEVMETVQIKKYHKHKKMTFALSTLDRVKVSELLLKRLEKLDDELNVLWSKKSRMNLRKIMRLYLEREKLNERYSIVSGSGLSARMTFKDIFEWRSSMPQSEALALRIGQAPDWMTEKIKELLTEAGFKIVKGDADKAVSLNVESIREYLNVKGFEKYTFTLNLTSFEKGEKNKILTTSETVTGRTQSDALLKVKMFFNNYIDNHLSDLHLD